jgi:hypothetical protein
LRTIQFWLREIERGRQDLHDAARSGRPPLDDVDAAIMRIIYKFPFESARSIAQTLNLAHSTILNHLHTSLGYQSFHLRWVPHLMTEDLMKKRKEVATQMLPLLEEAAQEGWKHFVTGDESWFFLSRSPQRMWSLTRDDVATKVRPNIQTKKIMFTIMWSPRGFHVINQLPDDTKMNSTYYVNNVLQELYQCFFPHGHGPRSKYLVIHVDNCSIHKSAQSEQFMVAHKMFRMSHPPYSPDLAPSDFYLFGTVKNQLEHIQLSEHDDFFEKLYEILQSIPKEELARVFTAWRERVRQVAYGTGDYIKE